MAVNGPSRAGSAELLLVLYGDYLCEVLRERLADDPRAETPFVEIASWIIEGKRAS